MKHTVGSTVTQRHPDVMPKRQIKVNPNLIMIPLSPLTYTSAQLHENIILLLLQKSLNCSNLNNFNIKKLEILKILEMEICVRTLT